MNEEITEIIKANLPEQVGIELRKELEQIASLREEVERLEDLKLEADDLTKRERALAHKTELLIADRKEYDERVEALRDKEIHATVSALSVQLASEREKTAFMMEVTLGLVRNTEYRQDMLTQDQDVYCPNTGQTITKKIGESTVETAQ